MMCENQELFQEILDESKGKNASRASIQGMRMYGIDEKVEKVY